MTVPSSSSNADVRSGPSLDSVKQAIPIITTVSLAIVALISFLVISHQSKLPVVNGPGWFELTTFKRLNFMKNGADILRDARKRYHSQPYNLVMSAGLITMLPPKYAQIIRNDPRLSFGHSFARDFAGDVHGLEPLNTLADQRRLVQLVIQKQLTKHLNSVTEPLSKEATFAVDKIFGNDPDWREIRITDSILQLVARLSTKVFLGDKLCRNESWLQASKEYTLYSFRAALSVIFLPSPLKYLMSFFSNDVRLAKQSLTKSRNVLEPIIQERRKARTEAIKNGEPAPAYNDMLDWLDQESKGGSYDPVHYQMVLSAGAIHTTSDLLGQTIMRLAQEPGWIAELRKEIIEVLSKDGLTKAALANLKLMDSALKEASRLIPISGMLMRRLAKEDITLPEGIVIKKGQFLAVDGIEAWKAKNYPEPLKFDMYRFYRLRQDPSTASKAHLVSTSPEHLGFGHGDQACPGRFFAANEMKIALCHLFLKYDWELTPGANLEPYHVYGDVFTLDPNNVIRFRRRKEEVDLEGLAFI